MNLLIAILLGFTAQAQAQTADEIKTIITCKRFVEIPEVKMSVEVLQGGFTGMTQVKVSRAYPGYNTTSSYYVHTQPLPVDRMGAGTSYVGNGVILHTNFTTSPLEDGGHYATLQISEGGKVENSELSCKLNEQLYKELL